MTPPGWPAGVGLIRHDVLDSTNEEARRLAAAGERGPIWITAREQTAGRGRRGRVWVSDAGNLFASFLIVAPAQMAAQLGFAAGLATGDVVTSYAGDRRVALKWPNDVLLDGRKVAGILLEGVAPDTLAIGIGINLAQHPPDTEFPAASLAAITGAPPEPDEALLRLAGRMDAWYEVWRNRGFAGLKDSWLARVAGLGKPIRARLHGSDKDGIFEGLDADGALLLRGPDGAVSRVTAGDVFFRE